MSTQTLADAQMELATAAASFTHAAQHASLAGDVARLEREVRETTATYIEATVKLIRTADQFLVLVAQSTEPLWSVFAAQAPVVQATRTAAFLILRELVPDEAWYWTSEWQAKEREVDMAYAEGRTTFHATTDDFLASLDALCA